MKIKELKINETAEISLMVKEILEKETKNGKKYVVFTLTDGIEDIRAKMWNTSREECTCNEADVIAAVLQVESYNSKPDYTVSSYYVDETADKKEFIKHAPVEVETMWQEIMNTLKVLPNQKVANMAMLLLNDHKDKLIKWTAARMVHHTGVGELLYHSYRMMKSGYYDCKVYKQADITMVVVGCILHDIGKLEEFDVDEFGNTKLTVDGALFGHAYLGCQLVGNYCIKAHVSWEETRQLCHIIASHHGKKEWGAIVTPSTMEALIVHNCDMRDAKTYIFEDVYKKMDEGTVMDEPCYFLDQAYIYKGKKN